MSKKILLSAALFFAFTSASAFAETWSGTVSESMCAAKHVAGAPDDVACIQKCVKGGSPAVLVVGDKIYKIDNQDAVAHHLGHKVNVTGTINGDTIHIDKVTM